jgi:hypothetical protein
LCGRRTGETPLRFAARFALAIGLTHLTLLAACIVVVSIFQGRPLQAYIPGFLVLICGGFAVNAFAITWLGLTVVEPFVTRPQEVSANYRRLVFCTLVAALTLMLTFVGLTAWNTDEVPVLVRTITLSLVAGGVLFPGICMAFVHECRQRRPWESLDLGSESGTAAIL